MYDTSSCTARGILLRILVTPAAKYYESIYVHFAGRKIAVTFLILARFQHFKDRRTPNTRALLLVLFFERYDAWLRI